MALADGSWNLFGQDQCSAIGMCPIFRSDPLLIDRMGLAFK